jgi:hypothetical protein
MTFDFAKSLQGNSSLRAIVISGDDSLLLDESEFLIITHSDSSKRLYEIKYEYHCSPFKEVLIVDNLLAVGHEEHFYLFDLNTKTNMLRLKVEGYFGHMYFDSNHFYVADAHGLYCIDKNTSIKWHNNSLAIDGVIITKFLEDRISGSGEWDPPGGWRDFVINKQTGTLTN